MVILMDWNNSTYIERLRSWKELREEVVDMPLHEGVQKIAEYWGTVPMHTAKTVSIYEIETWQTPWEILHENAMCENKIAQMIYHTLTSIYDSDDDIKIKMRIAYHNKEEFLVVYIDRSYLKGESYTLNYYINDVVRSENEKEINFIHTFDEVVPHIRKQ